MGGQQVPANTRPATINVQQHWFLFFLDTQVSLAPTHVQYNLHEPSYNLHEPGYNLHEPGYNLHEPGYNLHEPGYNLHEPEYNRRSFTL